MLPFHCDVLLPTASRYASTRFRRVAQRIQFHLLDYADAVELIGFVESFGLRFARYALHWKGPATVRAYRRLRKRLDGEDTQAAIQANISQMGMDSGLAMLRAMQDGGWTHGKLPWSVKMALKELRKAGNTIADIAKATGLSREQVKTACDVRRRVGKGIGAVFSGDQVGF